MNEQEVDNEEEISNFQNIIFIINKYIYSRTYISISYTILTFSTSYSSSFYKELKSIDSI